MDKRVLSLMGWMLLSGCAATPPIKWVTRADDATADSVAATSNKNAAQPGQCVATNVPQWDMQLQMINDLKTRGALHAALAHLDALEAAAQQTPAARYLRAELLRRTDRVTEASRIYQGLLQTCLAGQGYHGLGLIAARSGDLKLALSDLASARRLLPTYPDVRNDYGYALLLDRQRERARREFITAIELGGADGRAALNYLTVLFMEGKNAEALQFADRTRISGDDVQAIQKQATQLTLDTANHATPAEHHGGTTPGASP